MAIDFNQIIDERVKADDAARRESHIPSGKLSAGMLSYPIQWSVLKLIGVADAAPDEYALRKFARGNQVEDWFVGMVAEKCGGETQVEVEYRGCIGYVDLKVDNEPHEVKSVSNLKFKRIVQGYVSKNVPPAGPQYGHTLQVGLYGLALGSEQAHLHYIASDDLRLASYTLEVEDLKDDIDQTIDAVQNALSKGTVPVFEPREAWHGMTEYAKYIDFMQLTEPQIIEKLRREYPEAYAKLTHKEG